MMWQVEKQNDCVTTKWNTHKKSDERNCSNSETLNEKQNPRFVSSLFKPDPKQFTQKDPKKQKYRKNV